MTGFDSEPVLRQLKDFQRTTAELTFRRLYCDDDTTHRFLVADEVGLGKTLVARGVIAHTIDHLQEKVERIDIVYVCSNAQIARQNVRRIHVGEHEHFEVADRITMLPATAHRLDENPVNIISFTPGTSFELTGGSGRAEERAVLRLVLRAVWGDDWFHTKGSMRVFQGGVHKLSSFERHYRNAADLYGDTLDRSLLASFERVLDAAGNDAMQERFDDLCYRFGRARKHGWDHEDRHLRTTFIGDLRDLLARACLEALEPDLIILDEFQRFKHLITEPAGDQERTPAAELAHELFNYVDDEAGSKVRVLLLSATPYKMLTSQADADEDHHDDLIETVRFLLGDDAHEADDLRHSLRSLRRGLQQARHDNGSAARTAAQEVESFLRRVMVRTERLAATSDRSGMLHERRCEPIALDVDEVREYASTARLARQLDAPDPMEYWKSSPYLLSFMDDYRLSRALEDAVKDPTAALAADVAATSRLDLDAVRRFQPCEPSNARYRWLRNDLIGRGAWQLLWVPPSLPYIEPGGPFADDSLQRFTKRLLFSSWTVVPKAVATLLSYDAERHMVTAHDGTPPYENSATDRQSRGRLLDFAVSAGRLTGMPVLAALYPSAALTEIGDPLTLAQRSGGLISAREAVTTVAAQIKARLDALRAPRSQGTGDEAWYWAAPFLLDRAEGVDLDVDAFRASIDADITLATDADRLRDHLEQAAAVQLHDLGPVPTDLAEVVAHMALAGAGCVAARALSRITGRPAWSLAVRLAAMRPAWGVRSLFNSPEVTELLRAVRPGSDPYWRKVLGYCLDGNLQSVLDEYLHVLAPARGHLDLCADEVLPDLSSALGSTVSLRTVNYGVRSIRVDDGAVTADPARMRANFAVRLADDRSSEGLRPSEVRDAFNSPFWPFVVATTSAGQEGLDFHAFCHAIVHWNLPGNPVDLEQREGRIHRFKGHAVRRNVAKTHGGVAWNNGGDPWAAMFEAARADRPHDQSDIVPYWVHTCDDGATIDRYVPALPLSRDRSRAGALKRAVGSYRLAFGQPRQEELLAILEDQFTDEEIGKLIKEIRIDLAPRPTGKSRADC